MIKINGIKYNKLVWTALSAVFDRLMTVSGASPSDRAALKSEYLDPITYLIDSDGDGIPDAFDPTPLPVKVPDPYRLGQFVEVNRDLTIKTLAESVAEARRLAPAAKPATEVTD